MPYYVSDALFLGFGVSWLYDSVTDPRGPWFDDGTLGTGSALVFVGLACGVLAVRREGAVLGLVSVPAHVQVQVLGQAEQGQLDHRDPACALAGPIPRRSALVRTGAVRT